MSSPSKHKVLTKQQAEKLKPHNTCLLMPPLTDDEYAELKEDIALRGIQMPIVVKDNQWVISGRHRLRIGLELGIPIPWVEADPNESEWEQAFWKNVTHQRTLSKGHQAMSARMVYQVVESSQTRDLSNTIYGDLTHYKGMSGEDYRKLFNINHQYWVQAGELLRPTNDAALRAKKAELVDMIISNQISLDTAHNQIRNERPIKTQFAKGSKKEEIEDEEDVVDIEGEEEIDSIDSSFVPVGNTKQPNNTTEVKKERVLMWQARHEVELPLSQRHGPRLPPHKTPYGDDISSAGHNAESIREVFAAEESYRDLYAVGKVLLERVNRLKETNRFLGVAHERLQEVVQLLYGAVPYAICPHCEGDGCEECFMQGFMSYGFMPVMEELDEAF